MRSILAEAGVEYRIPADVKVRTPEDAARASKDAAASDTECFIVLCLDAKNGMKAAEIVTAGVLDSCLVHPREVFRPAIMRNAAAVVVVHNHPSGDTSPSAEDIRITRELLQAGKILDVHVLDHVVIGMTAAGLKWTSLRESGLVQF
jgi:DNA repair protein RadC